MVWTAGERGRILRKKGGEGMEKDNELDFDAVVAELNRQAHDKELEALANLTLLRNSYNEEAQLTPEEQEKRDLEERLRIIMSGMEKD